jgi:hypothetical protein
LLSTAALSLINAFMKPGIGWIRSFSIFVSLTVLARTTSVFYAVIICGPILILYFVDQYRRERSLKSLGITLLNILIFILPVAIIVIEQLPNMFAYYSPSNASQLRQPLSISAENVFLHLLTPFLGIPLVIALTSLFFINNLKDFSATFSTNARDFSGIAIGWWIFGYLGFLLANGYTSDVPKEVMYVVPALLLFSLSPILNLSRSPASFYRLSSVGLTIFSVVLFFWNLYQNTELAKEIIPKQATMGSVQRELANQLVSLPPNTTWQSYTSVDWGIPVSLITQYEFGEYRQHGGVDYFYNKEEYWDTWYPDMSLSELQYKLYDRTVNCIDAVVILRDPENQPVGMEDYSYSIAAFIANRIKNDSNWEHFENLDGYPAGTKYQIYLNRTPESTRSCQDVRK